VKAKKLGSDEIIQAESLKFAKYLSNNMNQEQINHTIRDSPFQEFKSLPKLFKDKSNHPNNTILRIYSILLSSFKNSSFKIIQFPFIKTPSFIFIIHGKIFHKNRIIFRAFGKGLTIALSMASLYGEFIERIQAGFFFSQNPYKPRVIPYYEPSNSKIITEQMKKLNFQDFLPLFKEKCYPFVEKLLPSEKELLYYCPYQDLTSKKITWIMTRVNRFTTGFASGNSYEEALVQAFCEIIERYSSFMVLKNQIKLPTIPNHKLSSQIQNIIKKFEQEGIQIIIKDASLDLNIPSVAVLFIFEKRKSKRFLITFGVASSLDVAVERCLGEAEQDANSITTRSIFNHQYCRSIINLYNTFPHLKKILPLRDYFGESYAQNNFYPSEYVEFLKEDYGAPEYEEFYKIDLLDEINYIFHFLGKKGYRIYMKDCNWLGFPCIKLFIPELNVGYGQLIKYSNFKFEKFKQKLLTNFSDITKDDLKILDTPEFILLLSHLKTLNSFFQIDCESLERYSSWKFFGLLAFALNREKLAIKYLKQVALSVPKSKNKKEILSELGIILPNCQQKSCESCRFKRECKFPILKDFESTVVKEFPNHLRRLEEI